MLRIGWVADVKNDYAVIHVPRASGCGGNCNSCGASCETSIHIIETKNTVQAKKGDFVEIEVSEFQSLKISLLVYIVPLTLFFLGLIGSVKIWNFTELQALAVGFVLLSIGFILLYFIDKRQKRKIEHGIVLRSILKYTKENNN